MRFVFIVFYLFSSLLYHDYNNTQFCCHISSISNTRDKEFSNYWLQLFCLEEDKESDEWLMKRFLIGSFNSGCKNIAASHLKVGYKSMRAILSFFFSFGPASNVPKLTHYGVV